MGVPVLAIDRPLPRSQHRRGLSAQRAADLRSLPDQAGLLTRTERSWAGGPVAPIGIPIALTLAEQDHRAGRPIGMSWSPQRSSSLVLAVAWIRFVPALDDAIERPVVILGLVVVTVLVLARALLPRRR